jgi:hypothetical protein
VGLVAQNRGVFISTSGFGSELEPGTNIKVEFRRVIRGFVLKIDRQLGRDLGDENNMLQNVAAISTTDTTWFDIASVENSPVGTRVHRGSKV